MKRTELNRVVTHTLKPAAEITEAIDQALALKDHGIAGAQEALAILEVAFQKHPADPRLSRILGTIRAKLDPNKTGDDAKKAQRAFQHLANEAQILREAGTTAGRVHQVEGGKVSGFDRRMMQAAVTLAEQPYKEGNCPAATILTFEGKVVAVGVNRAYKPEPDGMRHGEIEALKALRENIFAGMAKVLALYHQSGGALDPATVSLLGQLDQAGVTDLPFRDTAASLKLGGYFAPQKIERYRQALAAFVSEAGFAIGLDGKLNGHRRGVLRGAIAEGTLRQGDLASWDAYDRLFQQGTKAKMDLYTSLEPCGMCMQHCTSHGQIGRVVYGARDEAGGGLTTLPHFAELYFSLDRVPFELVGGVEADRAQKLYDRFFSQIYPKVRAGQPITEEDLALPP